MGPDYSKDPESFSDEPYGEGPDQCCLCGQIDLLPVTDGNGKVIVSAITFVLETAYGKVCSECIKRYPDETAVKVYFDEIQAQAAEEAAWADPENGPDPTDVYIPRDRHTGEEITLNWDN